MKLSVKRKKASVRDWNLGFGELNTPICKAVEVGIMSSLSHGDGPMVSVNLAFDNPSIVQITLELFADSKNDGPLLECKLSDLIDDCLELGDESDVEKLRTVLAKAVKAIDKGWPQKWRG